MPEYIVRIQHKPLVIKQGAKPQVYTYEFIATRADEAIIFATERHGVNHPNRKFDLLDVCRQSHDKPGQVNYSKFIGKNRLPLE